MKAGLASQVVAQALVKYCLPGGEDGVLADLSLLATLQPGLMAQFQPRAGITDLLNGEADFMREDPGTWSQDPYPDHTAPYQFRDQS